MESAIRLKPRAGRESLQFADELLIEAAAPLGQSIEVGRRLANPDQALVPMKSFLTMCGFER
jgi:hypothetical protein